VSRHAPESIVQAAIELVCERIPARYRLETWTEVMTLVPMRRGATGLTALNDELERRLNPGEPHTVLARCGLRVRSRIVQTRNDYAPEREMMNSELAFTLDWDKEEGSTVRTRRRRTRDRRSG
jgi:exodeoxyribonuclease V alpha subunit